MPSFTRTAFSTTAMIEELQFDFLGGLPVLFFWIALAAWGERAEYARKVEGRPSYELTQLKQEQHHQLENYGWTDRENGLARIPIQQAKERFLAEQH